MRKEDIRVLVKLYQDSIFLWDSKDERFYVKKFREEAWEDIGQKMNTPVEVLKDKIKSLMGSYRREKSREKRSGVYKSRWFAFKWFHFLTERNNPKPTSMEQNVKEQKCSPAEHTTEDNEDQKVILKKPKVTKLMAKKRRLNPKLQLPNVVGELTNVVNKITNVIQEHQTIYNRDEDEYELYGRLLAKKLRQLSKRNSQELMHDIDGLVLSRIYNDPMSDYPPHSVAFVVEKRSVSPNSAPVSPLPSP